MEFLLFFAVFVFGLIIGSFLNVVILRFNTGMPISRGRSKCFSCGKELAWYELVPLASFVFQKGACGQCGTKISWQYPLVELAGGLAALLAFTSVSGAFESFSLGFAFILLLSLFSFYIVICAYDIRHKVIPDFFSYGAALISLCLIAVFYFETGFIDPLTVISGPALFLFYFFFWFISKGTWMGLGDAKLALSVGWALGLFGGIAATLFAFWVGALVSICMMLYLKLVRSRVSLTMKSAIPFGPFILIGFFIVAVFHVNLQAILSVLTL